MRMTFGVVPPGYLFSSGRTGKKCTFIKLREAYLLKGSKSLREEERRVNAVLFGTGEPVSFGGAERVDDISAPTLTADVMLSRTHFVFIRNEFVQTVNAVSIAPPDSGVLTAVSQE